MALLPEKEHMQKIEQECINAFELGEKISAIELAGRVMRLEGMPMHCPYHHYLVPAVLLTTAHINEESDKEQFLKDLKTAAERAGSIPGGICGNNGCCGAAVGVGIFASIWQGTSPHAKSGWAACNQMTANALTTIASVEGPRCCKRVTFFSVLSAVESAEKILNVDLGQIREVKCSFFQNSRECKKEKCPFYPL